MGVAWVEKEGLFPLSHPDSVTCSVLLAHIFTLHAEARRHVLRIPHSFTPCSFFLQSLSHPLTAGAVGNWMEDMVRRYERRLEQLKTLANGRCEGLTEDEQDSVTAGLREALRNAQEVRRKDTQARERRIETEKAHDVAKQRAK
jgi:hypothetical protein